jgi:hypothetical protein
MAAKQAHASLIYYSLINNIDDLIYITLAYRQSLIACSHCFLRANSCNKAGY